MALTYPYNVHYTAALSLPEDWGFDISELHIKNNAYQFDFTPTVNGSNITLHYTLKTFTDHIAAEDVRQYKEVYNNIFGKISFSLYKTITPEGFESEETTTPKRTPTTSFPKDWKVCWPAIWLTFFFALFFSRLFTWLNSRSEETLYSPGSGYPLGGWLIFLGLSILSSIVIGGVEIFRDNYYSYSNWAAYGNSGGARLQYLVMAELAIRLTFIAGGSAIFFWFIKKRDIFPRMFLWYAGILLVGRVMLFLLVSFMPIRKEILDNYKAEWTTDLIRTTVYVAIWVTYILRSGQVKSTFLEPFRERIR